MTQNWVTDFNEYVEFVKRLGIQRGEVSHNSKNMHTDQMSFEFLHAVAGMVTEVAELEDLVKKHIAYDKQLDQMKIIDESGDFLFYFIMMLIDRGIDLNMLIKTNMTKLNTRYPNGYTHQSATVRDKKVEIDAMAAVLNRRDDLGDKSDPGNTE